MRRHATASSARSKARKPSGLGSSPPSARPLLRGLCLALLASVAAAALLAAPAQATEAHPYLPARSLSGFVNAVGVAADSQGDIYVADEELEAIFVYDAEGNELAEIATPESLRSLAVDGEGYVYVAGYFGASEGDVYRYEPNNYPFVGTPTYSGPVTVDSSEAAKAVAVDPSNNRLYVARTFNQEIARFTSAAEGSIESPLPGEAGGGGVGFDFGIDVYGANHDVYIGNKFPHVVKIYDGTTGNLKHTVEGPNPPGELFSFVSFPSLAVDQSNGDFYVVEASGGTMVVDQFDASGALVSKIGPTFGVEELSLNSSEPSDVAVDPTTGDIFVTSGSHVYAFEAAEEGPEGPTNRRTLTLTKSAGGSGGTGSVSSKPKGIKCGATCNSATASLYKNSTVVLTEKPTVTTTKTSTFVEWEGGDCDGLVTLTCTVTMDEVEAVTAVFGGESKPILEAQPLTLSKEGTGFGTVKASGLGCEADCTETTVLYQGETAKPAKIVVLTATPAFGSEFVEWGGACEGSGSCEVSMASPQPVTATFTAKPNGTLTVTKSAGGSGGTGSVSSKPKGIKCAATCSTQSAAIPQGESIVLTAKPTVTTTKTSTFVEWEGGDCDGLVTLTCTVTMDEVEAVTAVFGGESKPILEAQPLTLSKEGTGFGTVKASGLACEVLCTSATSLYQGETAKPAKIVILTATSAPGSKPVLWSGCTEITPSECEVSMASPQSVTATFDELE